MYNKVVVSLPQPEYSALLKFSLDEMRTPPEQIRYWVRQELERRGLLRMVRLGSPLPDDCLAESHLTLTTTETP